MRTRFVLVVLMVCLIWQGVSRAGLFGEDRGMDLDHVALHAVAPDHDHGLDSIHADGLDDVAHAHADDGAATAFLLGGTLIALVECDPFPPADLAEILDPFPYLDGPLRPPTSRS